MQKIFDAIYASEDDIAQLDGHITLSKLNDFFTGNNNLDCKITLSTGNRATNLPECTKK